MKFRFVLLFLSFPGFFMGIWRENDQNYTIVFRYILSSLDLYSCTKTLFKTKSGVSRGDWSTPSELIKNQRLIRDYSAIKFLYLS